VVVQAAAHGFDNSAAADLIAAKQGRYAGVALLPVTVSEKELQRLDAQGFRGVRFNYMKHLGNPPPIEGVMELSQKLVDLGWHLQIHMESALIEEMSSALKRSPVPVVIDHMGRVDASLGTEHRHFRHLLHLMESENFYIKLSGAERISRQGAPWKDAMPFARKLAAEFGDRVFWGTDWPHPNLEPIPDDGVLVDLIAGIAPSAAQRQRLLVDNPQRFYGFTR
jgi:2-pyrone-4,6-dicarboxylate lactonase